VMRGQKQPKPAKVALWRRYFSRQVEFLDSLEIFQED
jgi:hypothetical protein